MWESYNRPVVMIRGGSNLGNLQPAGCDGSVVV